MYTVYSKPNCPYCDMAKNLLESKGIAFETQMIGVDISRDEILLKFPSMRTVPIIVDDNGELIGGYDNLSEKVKNDGQQFLAG